MLEKNIKESKSDPKDLDNKGDLDGVNLDEPTKEDVKILKDRLSDKGKKLKNATDSLAVFEADKKKQEDKKKQDDEKKKSNVEKLESTVKILRDEMKTYNTSKKKDELEKEYPDILPELLVGKTDDQVKSVVEKQRAKNKELYGDSEGFIKPRYENADDVQKEIDETKKDKTQRGDNAAIKVLNLIREKTKF